MTTSAPPIAPAYVLLVLTALFWSGNFVLACAMHAAVPPMTLSFMRWLIAFALLAPFSLRHAWRERAAVAVSRPDSGAVALGITAFNSLVYTGVQTTTATNAAAELVYPHSHQNAVWRAVVWPASGRAANAGAGGIVCGRAGDCVARRMGGWLG